MKILSVDIKTLVPDPANVREHGERNIDAITASLKRFGQQKPIVVDRDNVVVAGNGTLGAAQLLGWKEIKIVRTNLAGAKAVAFAIADNRTAELAEWDSAELRALVSELLEAGAAAGTGFTASELAAMTLTNEDLDSILDEDKPPPDRADPALVIDFTVEQHRLALLAGKNIKDNDGDPADIALHAILRASDEN